MEYPVILLRAMFHKKRIVAELEMPPLHTHLSIDGLQIDGLSVVYLECYVIYIWKLIAIGIDFPIIRIALKNSRLRR